MAQKSDEHVELVGERDGDRDRGRRDRVVLAGGAVVVADRVGDLGVDALLQRVVAAHHALQLGELADHAGDQIGLGEPRGLLGLVRIGADERGELAGEAGDALDALALRAEPVVEGDGVELLRLLFERDLQVLLPEEAGVRQPRAR